MLPQFSDPDNGEVYMNKDLGLVGDAESVKIKFQEVNKKVIKCVIISILTILICWNTTFL